jgi:hypothetical protein
MSDDDAAPGAAPEPAPQDEAVEIEQELTIVNEFASVRIRKLRTSNGERLEIEAPRVGHVIRLDALALEGLSWQTRETVSGWLETPFGPEH